MQIVKYIRKSFPVDAVQVTEENYREVAEWCDGDIITEDDGSSHVKVDVRRPMNERQTRAYVGDWVLKADQGSFKVYTNKAFHKTFQLAVTATAETSPTDEEVATSAVVDGA